METNTMRYSRTILIGALLTAALVLAACGGAAKPAPQEAQPAQAEEIQATEAPQEETAQEEAPAQEAPQFPQNDAGFSDISVDQLETMMEDKNFTLVNVHIPFQGKLPDTDEEIPFNEISQNLDSLPGKDAPIVVYCRSGSMSTQAATELAALGYTNVMELDGGFNAWKAAGNELLMQ